MKRCRVEDKCRIVGGVDLSGTPKRPTGVAIIREGVLIYADKVFYDGEIIDIIKHYSACLVAIDAPLSTAKTYRKVDLAMKRRGFKVLPPGWRGMRTLTLRAMRIKRILEAMGVKVIETHPSSAIKSSGLYDIVELIRFFVEVHDWSFMGKGKDVVDAVIAACVAWSYVQGHSIAVKEIDGEIHLLPQVPLSR